LIHLNCGRVVDGHTDVFAIDAVIPGRDGELWKTWPLKGGMLEAAQLSDIVNWVEATVSDGLLRYFPVKGVAR
jgi:hypothetical protein